MQFKQVTKEEYKSFLKWLAENYENAYQQPETMADGWFVYVADECVAKRILYGYETYYINERWINYERNN